MRCPSVAPTRGPRMRRKAAASRSGHCGTARIASVAVNPGATALQRMPSLPHREATCRVSATDPGLGGRIGRPGGFALEMPPPTTCLTIAAAAS